MSSLCIGRGLCITLDWTLTMWRLVWLLRSYLNINLQVLVMVLMLCVKEWFWFAGHQHATWLFHMRDILSLVSGVPSGQVFVLLTP